MTQTTTMNLAAGGSRRRIRLMWLGMLVAVLATFAVTTWAQPMGHGMRHGGHQGIGPGMMMGGSPERMGRMVDHMLDGLSATDAQRSQIKQITQKAAADLKAQHQAARGLHERGLQIFTAPNVDPAAAEALRQQMLAQHDQASKTMMQAMLDISQVLTPEQRAKIGERMKERAAKMHDRMERMHKDQPRK
ncbi:MAG: Spy/CpxP family protein refolding chaperone [Caldimonas sp.]